MKISILLSAALLFAGCARYDAGNRGTPPTQRGTEFNDPFPYRSGPGLQSTDRDDPGVLGHRDVK